MRAASGIWVSIGISCGWQVKAALMAENNIPGDMIAYRTFRISKFDDKSIFYPPNKQNCL
jgi:hypothetical protein